MNNWIIKIEIWSHFTGNGRKSDDESVGGKERIFYIEAYNFDRAVEIAKAIVEGIKTNPMVWQAPIVGIFQGVPP